LQLLQGLVGYRNGVPLDLLPKDGQCPESAQETGTNSSAETDGGRKESSVFSGYSTTTPQSFATSSASPSLDSTGQHQSFTTPLSLSSTIPYRQIQEGDAASQQRYHSPYSSQQLVGHQILRSSERHDVPEILRDLLVQEDVLSDESLRLDILEKRITLQDIVSAGLKALSRKDPSSVPVDSHMPTPISTESVGDENYIDKDFMVPTDRIVMLNNMNQDPAERLPDLRMNNIRIKQVMFVAACVANASLLGFSFDPVSCEDEGFESPFFKASTTEEVAVTSCSKDFLHLKKHLRPSASQIMHSHHPCIDVLPFPQFRERFIKLISSQPPMIDEDELWDDLQNDGLICWGSSLGGKSQSPATGSGAPWDIRSWEAQPWFLQKWWILIGGAEGDIYKQTQWWCEMRGDKSCYPW
jgi:hypothetical protein